MNIVTLTTLFPNSAEPKLGIFVQTRLQHLLAQHPDINAVVIAPVPWFPNWGPFKSQAFSEYHKYADAPAEEVRDGIQVYHPRYLVIPKVGMLLAPFTLAWSMRRALKRLKQSGYDFQLIDGHYFYPDGVAIALSLWGNRLLKDIPFTVTARGTDLNLIPDFTLPKKLIQWTLKRCSTAICVCEALRQEALKLGATEDKVITLRNGVDLERFQPPADRPALQSELAVNGPSIISVGWLIERKGHYLIIEAMQSLPGVHLYIAGDGPDKSALMQQVKEAGLEQQISFLGALDQQQLRQWYGAVDALVLASSREGWANVLLEAMACGTPVVATRVWGTPEVVQNESVGELVERTAEDIARGVKALLHRASDRHQVRSYAEQFDCDVGNISCFKH